MPQLKLATGPDGTVHGEPDRATSDPWAVNTLDETAEKRDELGEGVGYVLINGGGSGGEPRSRESLRARGNAGLRGAMKAGHQSRSVGLPREPGIQRAFSVF